MPVPFLGRLNITEYAALVGSFILVGLEAIVRVLTLALPSSLITLFYRASRRLFNGLSSPAQKRAEERRRPISTSIRDASDFVAMCALAGYTAEEHVVQTKDGYLLGLHRLAWRQGEENWRVNAGPDSLTKRVVYLHHGLLMNSEVWVCLTDKERCLPFVLVEHGFDVWLGNNRGNKYSKKSIHCTSTSLQFWNFSIDEFAFHDIPDSIAYILETTLQPGLSYIGFSQGTAQAFASLAVHPKLNRQVNVFIALAPAMSPVGLSNGIVDALVKASPSVLFLLFGRRSILSSAMMWESILYPPIFIKVIDLGLSFLFNWRTRNISTSQKLAAYPHLYSYTSTKSVVHWFQIIRTKSFQMYDDDVHPPLSLSTSSKYTKVARYPTRNIRTPVVLIYGGSDSLVDIRVMLRELPPQTVATEIPHYEHLDFLWARDVDAQVFRHVFDALDSFTGAEHTKAEYRRYRSARSTSISASRSFRRHGHHDSLGNATDVDATDADVDGDPEATGVPVAEGAAAGGGESDSAALSEGSSSTLPVGQDHMSLRRRGAHHQQHLAMERLRSPGRTMATSGMSEASDDEHDDDDDDDAQADARPAPQPCAQPGALGHLQAIAQAASNAVANLDARTAGDATGPRPSSSSGAYDDLPDLESEGGTVVRTGGPNRYRRPRGANGVNGAEADRDPHPLTAAELAAGVRDSPLAGLVSPAEPRRRLTALDAGWRDRPSHIVAAQQPSSAGRDNAGLPGGPPGRYGFLDAVAWAGALGGDVGGLMIRRPPATVNSESAVGESASALASGAATGQPVSAAPPPPAAAATGPPATPRSPSSAVGPSPTRRNLSVGSMREGARGIRLSAPRAAGGVVTPVVAGGENNAAGTGIGSPVASVVGGGAGGDAAAAATALGPD